MTGILALSLYPRGTLPVSLQSFTVTPGSTLISLEFNDQLLKMAVIKILGAWNSPNPSEYSLAYLRIAKKQQQNKTKQKTQKSPPKVLREDRGRGSEWVQLCRAREEAGASLTQPSTFGR